ncbi:MAG TPA: hypothetical protein VFR34_02615 [Paracoccaceae bacterium]|nr:hypothetical protein [Paracoccaceae bacterium]
MKRAIATIAAILLGGAALAASPAFEAADWNDNDRLSLRELRTLYPGLRRAELAAYDLDGDRQLNPYEFAGLRRAAAATYRYESGYRYQSSYPYEGGLTDDNDK